MAFSQHILFSNASTEDLDALTEDLQRFQGILSTNNTIGVQVSKQRTSRFSTTYFFRLDSVLTIDEDIDITVLSYSPRINMLNGSTNRFQVVANEFEDNETDGIPLPVGRMLKPIVWDAGDAKQFGVEIKPFSLDDEIEAFHLYFGTFMWDTSTNTWHTNDVTHWQMFQDIHSAWVRENSRWSQGNAGGREEKRSE